MSTLAANPRRLGAEMASSPSCTHGAGADASSPCSLRRAAAAYRLMGRAGIASRPNFFLAVNAGPALSLAFSQNI